MMKWIIGNWYLMLAFALIIALIWYKVHEFVNLSREKKDLAIKEWKDKVINWLIGACLKAEEMFGSKTGILKLTEVYDMFIKTFPILVSILPFKTFKEWVDIALIEVRKILENNKNIAKIVYKE